MDDFLEIFKHTFHRFSLVGVKYIGERISEDKRKYFKFIGKFEFKPPRQIFDSDIEQNKPYILSQISKITPESSNCFHRKFTKKVLNGKSKTIKNIEFRYIFDIVPKNIIDFSLDEKLQKMFLYVKGYGTF